MRGKIIESERIALYTTEIEDVETVMRMEQDPENSKFVFVWPRERHMQAIEEADCLHLVVRQKASGSIIGYALIYGMTSEDQAIELMRIVIGRKGQGYGKELIRLVKKLCFEKLGCHNLWLDVYEDNIRARNLYEKEGFVLEGILRDRKKFGDIYRSMCVMSMLENEYK